MKIPLSWLKEFISLHESTASISEILTQTGIEVDAICHVGKNLYNCYAVLVRSVVPHPQDTKLCIAMVFDGHAVHPVVCSAQNCRESIMTAWAKPGAQLGEVAIRETEIKGSLSYGMLCSEKELGLSDNHDGIVELPAEIQPGTSLGQLYQDDILEVSLTPNLGHCLSMLGIARELSSALNRPYQAASLGYTELESLKMPVSVQINDKEKCFAYNLGLIRDVTVGPSPFWLKTRLQNAGIRSINNVVDCSNYIMLALGIPTHVFDADTITSGKIKVRSDLNFDNFCTLDGKERNIPPGVLMICDDEKPLAIAGLMGGQSSAVTESTTNILVEGAHFSPQALRASMKTLYLRSESANRFEKGIDAANVYTGLTQLMALILECAGGYSDSKILQHVVSMPPITTLTLKISNVNRILGTTLSLSEIESILSRLEMKTREIKQGYLEVDIPTYRRDITREIDLVEEIARVYGFNNLPISLAYHTDSTALHDPVFIFENKIRALLIAQNLQECIHCDLISPEDAKETAKEAFKESELIHVLHPSALEQSTLRASLLPGFLATARHNFDRGQKNLSLCEVGKIHYKEHNHFHECGCIGILLSGDSSFYHYHPKPRKFDFYDLKGKIENIGRELGINNLCFAKSHNPRYHSGRQATLTAGDLTIGILGQLHPLWLEKYGIEQPVYFAELSLKELYSASNALDKMKPLNDFPLITRDWTFSYAKEATVGVITDFINTLDIPYLESFHLLDIYAKQTAVEQNLTFRFIYRDSQRTLKSEEVDASQKLLEEKVTRRLLVK